MQMMRKRRSGKSTAYRYKPDTRLQKRDRKLHEEALIILRGVSIFNLLTVLARTLNSHGVIRGYVLMILPQVHLRKPCYDFYFL